MVLHTFGQIPADSLCCLAGQGSTLFSKNEYGEAIPVDGSEPFKPKSDHVVTSWTVDPRKLAEGLGDPSRHAVYGGPGYVPSKEVLALVVASIAA